MLERDVMIFSEYTYTRPNYEAIKDELKQLTQTLQEATSAQDTIETVRRFNVIQSTIDTQLTLWSIRHSIDMTDEFYNGETDFWNQHSPLFEELKTDFCRVLLDSPYRKELGDILPNTFFMMAENKLKTFSPEIIPLLQKENELVDAYNNLIASAKINFRDQVYNLSQIGVFGEDLDATVRQAAAEARDKFFLDNEEQFDHIYDQLVKVRHDIAQTLGFDNYVTFAYYHMNRFDYNADMVKTYRKEIHKHVVPVVQKLRERQAKRIQVDKLNYYDLPLEFLDGNAKPQGDPEFIVQTAKTMYQDLSPETDEFFSFMLEHDLLDLVAKPGKDTGGYCTYIADFKSPFIFSNFNGTSADIDVLTHEAGHAFQVYRSRWIEALDVLWPTYESCEIHSMSMEFLTWPYMERFFKEQTDKYKFSHLAGTLLFLPYGILVDHFQHEVYENPSMTPDERKKLWKKLEKHYLPDRDFSNSKALDKGIFWFRQGHIFASPFYYIDYTLAQVCALQFWKRSQVDHDDNTWEDYLRICDLGGTKSFLQIVEAANLQSPFKEGALESTIKAATDYLDSIDDMAL